MSMERAGTDNRGDTDRDVRAQREPLLETRGRSNENLGEGNLGRLGGGHVGVVPCREVRGYGAGHGPAIDKWCDGLVRSWCTRKR